MPAWRDRWRDLLSWLSRWRYPVIGGALATLLVVFVFARAARSPRPSYLPRRSWSLFWRPMVMGFYENGNSWGSFTAHARQIQIASPYWYRIDAAGNLTDDTREPVVTATAHQKGVAVWPLVGNSGQDPMDNAKTRANMASTILRLVNSRDYQGVLIDFELLAPQSRDDLSTFLNSLGSRLHAMGKGLGVAVFPKVGIAQQMSHPYDYLALGKVTDAVVLMTYDHHYQGGPPGPIAPLDWVRDNLQFALARIPHERIYLGAAAYGYDWTSQGASNTVSTRQAQNTLKKIGKQPIWDTVAQEYHFAYTDAVGVVHNIWYEDQRSFAQKLALARASRIGGVAIWELGFENPDIWRQVQRGHLL